MTSTRLSGKVLFEVVGKSLLEHQLERLGYVENADSLVVATSINTTDDEIERLCNRLNVSCFRGSELDVLSRYYEAATYHKADIIVRITADCPVIDPHIVDLAIDFYKKNINVVDFVSNGLDGAYPRGMNVAVFDYKTLESTQANAVKQSDREHVTSYIYTHRDKYRVYSLPAERHYPEYRFTVDTIEDFLLIKEIIGDLYPGNAKFTLDDIVDLMEARPELAGINSHVKQKSIS